MANLKDYGGGIFAANFTIDEPGKWGVICLFKEDKGPQTVKFWYPHMVMWTFLGTQLVIISDDDQLSCFAVKWFKSLTMESGNKGLPLTEYRWDFTI